MMRLTSILVVLAMVLGVGLVVCEAGPSTGAINVSATVPTNSLELTWSLSKVNSHFTDDGGVDDTWTTATSMGFGDLVYLSQGTTGDNVGQWFSQYYFPILLGVITTSGKQYTIKSASAGLSSSAKLPKGWGIAQVGCYDTTSKKFITCPEGTAGTATAAEGTVTLYTSANPPTKGLTVRADYAIPRYKSGGSNPFSSYEPIPLTQKGGTYSGTVTITVTD